MPGFQSTINTQQAPGVEGDFCSNNIFTSALSPEGGFITGTNGVTVGRFAWGDPVTGVVNNNGTGSPTGFVHRDMQAMLTVYLQESSMLIAAGQAITLLNTGEFWAKNTVATATFGQKVFASTTTGAIQPGAAGATISGFVETNFAIRSNAAVGELVKISSHGK